MQARSDQATVQSVCRCPEAVERQLEMLGSGSRYAVASAQALVVSMLLS